MIRGQTMIPEAQRPLRNATRTVDRALVWLLLSGAKLYTHHRFKIVIAIGLSVVLLQPAPTPLIVALGGTTLLWLSERQVARGIYRPGRAAWRAVLVGTPVALLGVCGLAGSWWLSRSFDAVAVALLLVGLSLSAAAPALPFLLTFRRPPAARGDAGAEIAGALVAQRRTVPIAGARPDPPEEEAPACESWAARRCVALIRAYRAHPTALKERVCLYHPTCSRYAEIAIARFGLLRGGWLAVRRVFRCNPPARGGHDPVPDPREAGL